MIARILFIALVIAAAPACGGPKPPPAVPIDTAPAPAPEVAQTPDATGGDEAAISPQTSDGEEVQDVAAVAPDPAIAPLDSGGAADETVTDASDLEAAAPAKDLGATEDVAETAGADPGPSIADAALDDGPSDGTPAVPDAGEAGSADQADGVVEVAPDTATLDTGPPQCKDKWSGMPMPGEPCSKVGEIRCSDAGAVPGPYPGPQWSKVPAQKVCIRPTRVECKAGTAGSTWAALPCGAPANKCGSEDTYAVLGCVEYSDGPQCAPFSELGLPLCYPDEVGQVSCLWTGSEGMYRCQKWSEPVADAIAEGKKQGDWAKKAACCPDCRYWLLYKSCPGQFMCQCAVMNPETCNAVFGSAIGLSYCMSDPNGANPTCATTCADMKKHPIWGKYIP